MQIDLKDHFIKALEAEPNFSEAHLQLALLYKEEEDHNNVTKHFDLAISSDIEEVEKLEEKGDELIKNFHTKAELFFGKNKKLIEKDWKDFEIIMNKNNIARKECLLLPVKVLQMALENKK